MSNVERFRAAYTEKLTEAVRKYPEEYLYGEDKVPEVVEKMLRSLPSGAALVTDAVKAAARAVGIKPTVKAIKEFLSERSE